MPFSIIAVLIMVCSIAAGAYMQQVNDQRLSAGRGSRIPDIEAVLSAIQHHLEEIADQCTGRAVDAQLVNDGVESPRSMWQLDLQFKKLFGEAVAGNYTGRLFKEQELSVNASVREANLSAQPMVYRTMNRFGMLVNTSGAGALRALALVDLVIRAKNAPPQARTVNIDRQTPSWYPYMLEQACRMRRDCAGEGLVELLMKEMLTGYLYRSLPVMKARWRSEPSVSRGWSAINFTGLCRLAIQDALLMEEKVLLARASPSRLNDYFNANIDRHFRVASALPTYSFDEYSAPWAEAPEANDLYLDIPEFTGSIPAYYRLNDSAPSAFFSPFPNSSWRSGPDITTTKWVYAGEEVMADSYVLEMQVHGTYHLVVSPDGVAGRAISFDVPVHLDFMVESGWQEMSADWAERGKDHCQKENASLFDDEFMFQYSAPVRLSVAIEDPTGADVRSSGRPFTVALSIDSEPAGLFKKQDFSVSGLTVARLPRGPHTFDVALTYSDGAEILHGSASASFTGTLGNVTIRADRGMDTARFWSVVMAYIREVPYDLRMSKMLELFSKMAGYPMPAELAGLQASSPASVQRLISWGQNFHRYLVAEQIEGASGAAGDHTEAMISTIEVMLEVTGRIEGLLAGLAWDTQARSLAISALNITVKALYDKGSRTNILEINFESAYSKAVLRFGKAEDGKDRWSLEMPQKKDYQWTFDPLEKNDRITLAFEGAVDILFIAAAACSLWNKYQKYQSSDGGLSAPEVLDLSLSMAQICLRLTTMVVTTLSKGLFKGISEEGGKVLKIAGEYVNFVAGFLQLVQMWNDELEKFQGDEAAWAALFTGFDETTVTFYLTVASTLVSLVAVLAMAGAAWGGGLAAIAFLSPFLGPIGAVLALVTLLVMICYNSEAIGCWMAGTSTTEARDKTIASIGSTLQGTVGTMADLNEFKADEMMLEARSTRGTAFLLDSLGVLVNDASFGFQLANISAFSYDMAWAKEHQAKAVRCLRYFLVTMWKQANDFHDDDSVRKGESQDRHNLPDKGTLGGENDWHVDIKVTDPLKGWELRQLFDTDIEGYLLGLTADEARNVSLKFILTITKGGVSSDGLQAWVDTVGRISDMVTLWQNRLAASQAMVSYVQGISSQRYRNDLGYLQIRMSDAYSDAKVIISSHDGKGFRYFTGKTERWEERSIQYDIGRPDAPCRLYLQPGKYDVEISDHTPASETRWTKRTVNVHPFYSPKFSLETMMISARPQPIFFTIDDRLNGTVDLSVLSLDGSGSLQGTLMYHRKFNMSTAPGDKFYVDDSWIPGFNFDNSAGGETDEMKASLKMKVHIDIGIDNDSDGDYETRESIEIPASSIRNDHVMVMQANDAGKHNEQLEYRLIIFDSKTNRVFPGIEGDLIMTRYTYWDTITQF